MKRLACAAAVLGIALHGAVCGAAEAAQKPAAYAACMAKANTTVDMQACQETAQKQADRALSAAFAKAVSSLPPDQQTKLREAQRRWVAFRTSDCQVFSGSTTGSIASIAAGECLLDRSRQRIENLAGFSAK